MAITQTVPAYSGDMPDKNTQSPETFDTNAQAWVNYQVTLAPAQNTYAGQANTLADEINAKGEDVSEWWQATRGYRDETAILSQECEAQALSAAQAASQAQSSATQAADFVDLNNAWMAANALGLVIAPRQQEANLTVTAGNQGISYGPAILASNVRVVVESGAIWRIF